MNENVKTYKGVLLGFGIASFASFACIAMFFIPIYSAFDCGKQCCRSCGCGLCENITPIKRVALFYLVCLPTVVFSIFAFFFTLSKKSTYNEYSSMQYINDLKNMSKSSYSYRSDEPYDHFGKSITYNNAQFIILLIILIFIVLYPILVWLTSSKEENKPSTQDIKKTALNAQRNNNVQVKKVNKKNKDAAYNSTELMPAYNSNSSGGYNSHPPQNYNQGYGYQPPNYQPNWYPPQQNMYPSYVAPQGQYPGEQPYYQK